MAVSTPEAGGLNSKPDFFKGTEIIENLFQMFMNNLHILLRNLCQKTKPTLPRFLHGLWSQGACLVLGPMWALRKEQVFAYCLYPHEAISSLLNDTQPFVEHAFHAKCAVCTSVK